MPHRAWSRSAGPIGIARAVGASAIVLFAALSLAARVGAQVAAGSSLTLTVVVVDSLLGDPVAGVLVHLRRSPSVASLTNDRGRVVLTDVPARVDTLVLKRIGYHARELPIDPAALGESLTVRIVRERV